MKFDIFLSICQTEVDGYLPDEKTMWRNFFDQVVLADQLGFGTAWVAETHLSTEIQKQGPQAVIPHFVGEIGLNTDILQLAHKIFAQTKKINVGSAIRNILCNGGPIAHAEAVKTFLSLHGLNPEEKRQLHIGFASGRFEFSNRPYGIVPRNSTEEAAWPVVKTKILDEATEIFLRLLKGEVFSSEEVETRYLTEEDFRKPEDWQKVVGTYAEEKTLTIDEASKIKEIYLRPRWNFERLGVIPRESRLDLLRLTIGTHDAKTQELANRHMPVGVFNLSITPPDVIEQTHQRMREAFHADGGEWQRWMMPRTAQVFLDNTPGLSADEQNMRARAKATAAWKNFMAAMQGTIDDEKIEKAVTNSLAGNSAAVIEQIRKKYHPDDRLMLWFDFNNHNNHEVQQSMRDFMQQVAPSLSV